MSASSVSTLALDSFCRAHWRRLYSAACQRGCTPVEAEDVVQELFLSLARRGVLEEVARRAPEAQVAYLFLRLRCLLINRWRDANSQRRGSQAVMLPLDDEIMPELSVNTTPATEADKPWLAGCITAAVDRLRHQTREKTWYEIGPDLLHDESQEARTGARRVALHRARKKLRHLLREEMNGSFQDWMVLPVAKTSSDA